MRRATHLFERVVDMENLRVAFHNAARGRRDRPAVQRFALGVDRQLTDLAQQLRSGAIEVGRFRQFRIWDPKERVITAPCFQERVMHHALMNVCGPILDKWLIADTFACRSGLGREAALRRARQFSSHKTWFLKMDVRKYFDNVNHARLIALLERRFRDQRLMELIYRIINSYRGDLGVGLPIGSLTSQHFANLYLGVFDRYAKEVLRYRGYVRYMDDVVLWGHSREELEKARASCNEFVRDELALEFKAAEPRRVRDGLPFLGCRVFSTHLELNARSKRRWRRRVRVLERSGRLGLMSDRELQQRLTALTAFASAAGTRSWRFRRTVLQTRTVDSPERLGPGHPWRQLREPCGQLPAGESQQECPVEPR